ncbi:hypothetical protein [Streptomyces sp. Caat 7-52]|uniref:hypothetical protein n=1 Tax=Streptomyces sp. Caat 7-52 TaxID=2949637 RepID=UPI0020350F7B|nr:hypothetical protein [Streptomyces sp. Caat 7-52]
MKNDIFRISAGIATATLTVLTSTACGTGKPVATPESVTHHELVGRWDGERRCGSPTVRLRDDYTFSSKDFPVQWDGPVPDAQVTRRSSDGKWHGVNKDPGLSPYLVLRFNNHNDIQILDFYLEHGKLRMNGTVHADGGDPYPYPCHYKRTSVDPEAEGVSPDHLATQSRSPSASAWASSAVKTNDPMT